MRSGKAYLATPVGRFTVQRNVAADLMAQLERYGWLAGVRRAARNGDTPGRFKNLVRRLEDALFDLAAGGGGDVVQRALIAVGAIQQYVATSAKLRGVLPPAPILSADWVAKADDNTAEFRIAAALAGVYAPGLPMRAHLAAVDPDRAQWKPDSRVAVWSAARLEDNLVAVLQRRLVEAGRNERIGAKPFGSTQACDLPSVCAYLSGETDDGRIADLLAGLVLVRAAGVLSVSKQEPEWLPGAYACLKPLFSPDSDLVKARIMAPGRTLPVPEGVLAQLHADHLPRAMDIAWRRLHASGVALPPMPHRLPSGGGLPGRRLAAALLIPLAVPGLKFLGKRFLRAERHGEATELEN